ncbi:MAG: triose-phosphate isomerase [Candidatus Neomarinimicrobiota bacterium]
MKQRRPVVAANWKMYKTPQEGRAYVDELGIKGLDLEGVDIILCVPYTSLLLIGESLENGEVEVGAQNMHWAHDGAYTGEISPRMIKSSGAGWVILGHSERRHIFGEMDEEIVRKIRSALDHDLSPIICIGETLQERRNGETLSVLRRQLGPVMETLSHEDMDRAIVAYEPVWAIGTGVNATPAQVQEAHGNVRKLVAHRFPAVAGSQRIIYGGSVNPDNAGELMEVEGVDGFLVGGASLTVDSFIKIIRAVQACHKNGT